MFFYNQAILIFCNNIAVDFNQKFLEKLPKKLYIYDFINIVKDNSRK